MKLPRLTSGERYLLSSPTFNPRFIKSVELIIEKRKKSNHLSARSRSTSGGDGVRRSHQWRRRVAFEGKVEARRRSARSYDGSRQQDDGSAQRRWRWGSEGAATAGIGGRRRGAGGRRRRRAARRGETAGSAAAAVEVGAVRETAAGSAEVGVDCASGRGLEWPFCFVCLFFTVDVSVE